MGMSEIGRGWGRMPSLVVWRGCVEENGGGEMMGWGCQGR